MPKKDLTNVNKTAFVLWYLLIDFHYKFISLCEKKTASGRPSLLAATRGKRKNNDFFFTRASALVPRGFADRLPRMLSLKR